VKAVGPGDEYPDLKVLGLFRYTERLVVHQHKKNCIVNFRELLENQEGSVQTVCCNGTGSFWPVLKLIVMVVMLMMTIIDHFYVRNGFLCTYRHLTNYQTLLGSVSSPLCVWKLERVCSQTQLCHLRCLMTILDNYMFRPLLAIFRLSSR